MDIVISTLVIWDDTYADDPIIIIITAISYMGIPYFVN
jgi:hypothetical protein